jgi:holo-[acyl-carrier protein] synthase
MIRGIGADIVRIPRMAAVLTRYGQRFANRILAAEERDAFAARNDPERFLAKRFAAKEAFGKALGTGVAAPATLHAVVVDHDGLGKPIFRFGPELARYMNDEGLHAHLTLTDETDYVVAFVVVEQRG